MTAAESLTPGLLDLMEHEKVIEQGLSAFMDVGWALLKIRDKKKYKASGYSTFEEYCSERWAISRGQGRRLMAAAETVTAMRRVDPDSDDASRMVPTGTIPDPQSEAQVRPLTPLRDEPAKAAEAWAAAVDDADGGQPTARQVEEAVEKITRPAPISKPDVGGGVSHPARFSDPLLPVFAAWLTPGMKVLDPFAGTGKIHLLRDLIDVETTGIEIEPEWATLHEHTRQGNALKLDFDDGAFDAIVTSPTYGNRFADHHNASDPELRRSYTHDLGHTLSEDNSGDLHWGDEYRKFHERAWDEAERVLRSGGLFILNISDHVRAGELQLVSSWHVAALAARGLRYLDGKCVPTSRLRQGTNAELRAPGEYVFLFEKP